MRSRKQIRDSLRKHKTRIKVGVLGAAAVASPPTGVEGELHQVGKPKFSAGSGRTAARQSAKLLETYGLFALRRQVGVEEREVSDLILGVVVDILGHIHIKVLKFGRVSCTSTP